MKLGKKVEKEIVVSISEIMSLSAVYYDDEGKEIQIIGRPNSGLTYSRIGYKKVKKYRVESRRIYNRGYDDSLMFAHFINKEEAEETYKELLNMNGQTCVETIIDKKSFKNEK